MPGTLYEELGELLREAGTLRGLLEGCPCRGCRLALEELAEWAEAARGVLEGSCRVQDLGGLLEALRGALRDAREVLRACGYPR